MSFKDLHNIQLDYQTKRQDVLQDFYIPCLKEAKIYKRAVGFFSSTILLHITEGLSSLIQKNGKMQLLVSPSLESKDYEAIRNGYEIREYVTEKLIRDFDEKVDFMQKEDRFAMLAFLISHEILDIKIAVLEEENDREMYHEKLGIMYDEEDNIIMFSGSANETYNGYKGNYENIDVFCSWSSLDAENRCFSKEKRFDNMWNNEEKGLHVIPFPNVIKEKILKYKKDDVDFVELDKNLIQKMKANERKKEPSTDSIELYDYQKEAIEKWVENGYRGIFDMATGTGKTFTGCGAITRLFEDKKRLFVYIVCPYIHLVDQWANEVKLFGINPICCYGGIKYQKVLERYVNKFRHKRTDFVCIITTNSTFHDKIMNYVSVNIKDSLLLVDEAHNFGATRISECMELDFPYRLALSATIDRFEDPIGTKKLYDFFGNKCIEYTLQRAIIEKKLTPYYYYPILVNLTDQELEDYLEITDKIKAYHHDREKEMPAGLKRLLIKRARLVAGARNKIDVLMEKMEQFKDDSNILVYCGAVKYGQYGYNEADCEIKQITTVFERMKKDLHMCVAKFTSEENAEERRYIVSQFKEEEIQALIAIKCLDEGMNIPAIKTAFILASSTNPKEYIQRRGRVLRKAEGKKYATIFDFITIPRPIDEASFIPKNMKKDEMGLVQKELYRMLDFAALSENPSCSNEISDLLKETYEIDLIEESDLYE